jgi:hypothetical protein
MLVFTVSLFTYEFLNKGSLRLQRPSLFVIAGIAAGVYEILSVLFYGMYNDYPLTPRAVLNSVMSWAAPVAVLWYVKSHDIRVRLRVVAWAFSVIVALMLILWLVIFFVWRQKDYVPYRSLFGLLTGKSAVFEAGAGNSNYLMPYFPTDESLIPGVLRYVFFFHGPESLALVVSFIALLALDLKNRLWSLLLLSISYFLLMTSGTRSAFIVLPLVIIVRYLLTANKVFGLPFVFGMIAVVSFTTLSIPPVTNLVFSKAANTAEAAGSARADSTEVRGEIYRRTWEGFVDGSDAQLFFGHVVKGETVLPGYAPAQVGSHSFLLSTLLYRSGFLGTGIFLTYWASLILWLYTTRSGRPMSCLLMFLLFSLTFAVMEFESVVMPITLICATVREPKVKFTNQLPDKAAFDCASEC